MPRPRCFIVHESLRRDHITGDMVPVHNLGLASEYGDVTFILTAGANHRPPEDVGAVLPALKATMSTYRPIDYIVLVGNPELYVLAAALALRASGGVVNLLKFDNRIQRYVVKSARLWTATPTLEPESQDHA